MRLLEAIAAGDREALTELLADDVVFHSPVQTYRGRDQTVLLLATVGSVIEEVEATRDLDGVTFFAPWSESTRWTACSSKRRTPPGTSPRSR